MRVDYERDELAALAADIEHRVVVCLNDQPCDMPGPALLALLRIAATLIALSSDEETLESAIACAKDILDHRAREEGRGTVH